MTICSGMEINVGGPANGRAGFNGCGFGSRRPGKALAGALLFGAFDAYQLRLQQLAGAYVPYQVFLMLPFILSIIALIIMSRRAAYPRALMVPYRKGER